MSLSHLPPANGSNGPIAALILSFAQLLSQSGRYTTEIRRICSSF
jgi:hypothetical protein